MWKITGAHQHGLALKPTYNYIKPSLLAIKKQLTSLLTINPASSNLILTG